MEWLIVFFLVAFVIIAPQVKRRQAQMPKVSKPKPIEEPELEPIPPHGMVTGQHEILEEQLALWEPAAAEFSDDQLVSASVVLDMDLLDEPPQSGKDELARQRKWLETTAGNIENLLNGKILWEANNRSFIFESDYEKELEKRLRSSLEGINRNIDKLDHYWEIAAQKSRIDFLPSIDSQLSTKSLPSS